MKKQQNIEEKLLEKQSQKVYAENEDQDIGYQNDKYTATDIDLYAALLIPFYDNHPALPKFFQQLLETVFSAHHI